MSLLQCDRSVYFLCVDDSNLLCRVLLIILPGTVAEDLKGHKLVVLVVQALEDLSIGTLPQNIKYLEAITNVISCDLEKIGYCFFYIYILLVLSSKSKIQVK